MPSGIKYRYLFRSVFKTLLTLKVQTSVAMYHKRMEFPFMIETEKNLNIFHVKIL